MNLLQTLRLAARALLIHKMRSFLTILGVIIGVGAVIAMVAIGEGAKARVAEQFASMGSNLLILQAGAANTAGLRGASGSAATLTWDDLDAIRTQAAGVLRAAPQLRGNAQLVAFGQNWATSVIGTNPDFFPIRNWKREAGDFFGEDDVKSGNTVAVIGHTVSDMLFGPDFDPVGQTVLIRNVPFTVVGLLAPKGQSGFGQDEDDVVIVPNTAYQTKIQGGLRQYLNGQVLIQAASEAELPRAEKSVAALLRDRHHLGPDQEDDFRLNNLTEMAAAREEGTQALSLLLASIAAVSLVVGGIGIMNIMLVSVTERTREIGLRMALGATPGWILQQFLIESVTLSLIGGAIGLALGVGAGVLLGQAFGWPIAFSAPVMVLAIGFSGAVGVIFGLYPARRAAALNPIDALRFE